MHLSSSLLLLAALPLGIAGKGKGHGHGPHTGLHTLAKQAGLKYFGSATDSPGQRERAGYEDKYAQYDQIMWKSGEFGLTTPTNGQKWLFTEPERGVFNFTEGDIVTNLARKHGFMQRCHALVWHSQLAPWVESTEWTPEELRQVIVNHITHVAGYYKGKCYAWDVVNEALNEDGTYRESVFYKVLGEDYIKLAFETAAKVDPHAKLYYNDYNLESPSAKTEGAKRIVKMLKDAGIRIDGVGLQAHLVAESHPTLDEHIDAIKGFTELGVEVALTELDIRLSIPANATNLAQQREAYKNVVGACVQVRGCIGVEIWDFYDPFSWVPATFPGQGAPLLWFEDFSKHPAYDGVVEALTNRTTGGCKGKGKGKGKVWKA
ncbi:glycoside hydrolase family 10 protein [Thermothelomyces thermophilus ATCC 42464]|uniref:Beta-xylanase n=1 Tax=Thermothelomyces thermophilus (strain ATCC 42464 / BCRC 31852 / DSM 1799) TaxID=573729 RepID=G2QGN6_THET4|nr:glycoside hydrolase family 10 protein [Thermothelomyces thermophilus ATCC 42464]AEO58598.1 glycoside hydrolase family 10 protein [Thermothelomyces thermophilus ATCC 42464]